jgi:hypothetical protein
MGMSVSALLKVDVDSATARQGLRALEQDSPPEMQAVGILWRNAGFFALPEKQRWLREVKPLFEFPRSQARLFYDAFTAYQKQFPDEPIINCDGPSGRTLKAFREGKRYEEIDRPALPDLSCHLETKEGFWLYFGTNAAWIYHDLGWREFLIDPKWQESSSAHAGLSRPN